MCDPQDERPGHSGRKSSSKFLREDLVTEEEVREAARGFSAAHRPKCSPALLQLTPGRLRSNAEALGASWDEGLEIDLHRGCVIGSRTVGGMHAPPASCR